MGRDGWSARHRGPHAFGERGRRAEAVGQHLAREARAFRDANVPVGPHLADQIVLPLALGGGGAFSTVAPTEHLRTQARVVERFIGATTTWEELPTGSWRVQVRAPSPSI